MQCLQRFLGLRIGCKSGKTFTAQLALSNPRASIDLAVKYADFRRKTEGKRFVARLAPMLQTRQFHRPCSKRYKRHGHFRRGEPGHAHESAEIADTPRRRRRDPVRNEYCFGSRHG
jgi:hypothetical protein